jgi:hypothetical protein
MLNLAAFCVAILKIGSTFVPRWQTRYDNGSGQILLDPYNCNSELRLSFPSLELKYT